MYTHQRRQHHHQRREHQSPPTRDHPILQSRKKYIKDISTDRKMANQHRHAYNHNIICHASNTAPALFQNDRYHGWVQPKLDHNQQWHNHHNGRKRREPKNYCRDQYGNQNNQNPTFNGVQNAIIDALAAPLGIDQSLSNKFEISTYPNPVNNVLNITYSKIQATSINFSIVDILGKVVLSSEENLSYSINQSIKSINVSALNNGNYFLEISSESIVESIPFVVSH